MKRFFQISVLSAGLLASSMLQAACFADTPLTRPDSRYEAANASGSEVKDKETGLVWQRCFYGLKWDGAACTGTVVAQDWKLATKTANDAKWRLPTQAELESLSEKSCLDPAVNSTWFGSGPTGWTWTSTDFGSADGAVVVNSSNSLIANLLKKFPLYARWVRN